MRFESKTFWLAKDADSPDQYQDAFGTDAERGVAAIADGVTTAIFSARWARLLTDGVLADPRILDDFAVFQDWLAERRAAWRDGIDLGRLTWFQRPKMIEGAKTTLLWLELTPADGQEPTAAYRMRSFAIGDCCMFHLRQDALVRTFPMGGSAAFGLDPAVVGSIDRKQDHLLEFQAVDDQCLPGDLLVLATDAIALWAMKRLESGEPVPWASYWDMPEEAWREEIFTLRNATQMRFDDSTLVLLRVIEETAAPAPVAAVEGGAPTTVAESEETPAVEEAASIPVEEPVAAPIGVEAEEVQPIPVEEPAAKPVGEVTPANPLAEPEPAESLTSADEPNSDAPNEPKES